MPALPAYGQTRTPIADIFSLIDPAMPKLQAPTRVMRNSRCIAMALPPELWKQIPIKLRQAVNSWTLQQYKEAREFDADSLFNIMENQALRINDAKGNPIAYLMEKDEYEALRQKLPA